MSNNSDPLVDDTLPCNSVGESLVAVASNIPFKFLALIFIVFLILNTDVFVGRILSRVDSAVEGKKVTTFGTCVQGLILVLACTFIHLAIQAEVL